MKLRNSPANDTRPNNVADTGASATSAQMVAASIPINATAGRRQPASRRAPRPHSRVILDTPSRMPSVAPNERWKPGSSTTAGATATASSAAIPSTLIACTRWSSARASSTSTATVTALATDAAPLATVP